MKLKSLLTTLAAFVGLTTAAVAATDENGLTPKHWYKYDGNNNSSGVTALDRMNGGTYADALDGKALKLDNGNSYGDNMALGGGDFTITTVVKGQASIDHGIVWCMGSQNSTKRGFALTIHNSDTVAIRRFGFSADAADILTCVVPGASTAYHFYALTFVESTKTLSLYVDGAKVAATCTEENLVDYTDGRYQFRSRHGGTDDGLNVSTAYIDDFRVYQSALTAAQIANICGTFIAEPVAVWDTFDGLETTLDSSDGNYTLTKVAGSVEDGVYTVGATGGLTIAPKDGNFGFKSTVIMDVEDIPSSSSRATLVDLYIGTGNKVLLDSLNNNFQFYWNDKTYGDAAALPASGKRRIAMVYNGSGKVGESVFVDGVKQTSGGAYSSNTAIPTIALGAKGGSAQVAEGLKIHNVAVFTRSLTDAEVAAYQFPSEKVVSGRVVAWNKDLGLSIANGDFTMTIAPEGYASVADGIATVASRNSGTASDAYGVAINWPAEAFDSKDMTVLVKYSSKTLLGGNSAFFSAFWGESSREFVYSGKSNNNLRGTQWVDGSGYYKSQLTESSYTMPNAGVMLVTMKADGSTALAFASQSGEAYNDFTQALTYTGVRDPNQAFYGIKIAGSLASLSHYYRAGMTIEAVSILKGAWTAADFPMSQLATVLAAYGEKATPVEYTATLDSDKKWSEIEWTPALPSKFNYFDTVKLTVTGKPTLTMDETYAATVPLTIDGTVVVKADDTLYTDGCWEKTLLSGSTLTADGVEFADVKEGFVGAYTKTDTGLKLRGQNKEVISINICGGNSSGDSPAENIVSGSDFYGIAPTVGDSWNNINKQWQGGDQTITIKGPKANNGTETVTRPSMALSATGKNTWQANLSNPFLRGYLDDGNGVSVVVEGIPYETYDVIIYGTSDRSDTGIAPVEVNGVKYTFVDGETVQGDTAWGQGMYATPELGRNAIMVKGCSNGTLTINATRKGYTGAGTGRATLCAVQVINMGGTPLEQIEYVADMTGDVTWTNGKDANLTSYGDDWANGQLSTITITNKAAGATLTFGALTEGQHIKIVSAEDCPINIVATSLSLGKLDVYDFSEAAGGVTIKLPTDGSAFDTANLPVSITGNWKYSSTGLIAFNGSFPSSTEQTFFKGDEWQGTVWLKNVTLGGNNFGNFCNTNSVLRFTGVTGWMSNGKQNVTTLELVDDGDTLAYEIWDSSQNYVYTFAKIIGSGSIKFATKADSGCVLILNDVSEFTGKLLSKAGYHRNAQVATTARPIFIGETGTIGTTSLISVADGMTVNAGYGWEAATAAFGATLTAKGAVGDAIVSVTTAPTLATKVTLDPAAEGIQCLTYADGAVKVAAAVGFTIEACDNAKFTSIVGAFEEDGTYYAADGAAVAVTYTADEGYAFTSSGSSVLVVNATAAEGGKVVPTEDPVEAKAKIGTVYYTTFAAAVEAANAMSSATVELLADATIESDMTVNDTVAFTIAEGLTLTVKKSGLTASKVTNNGTIAFVGGTAEEPIVITGDADFGVVTLAADTFVKNNDTTNRKHLVSGAGATSYYQMSRNGSETGFNDGSALTNLTLVVKSKVWLECVTLTEESNVRIETDADLCIHDIMPIVTALSGTGTVSQYGTATLTIVCNAASEFSGTSSVAFTIAGSEVQTLSGNYTGALTVNEGATVALDGSAAPSSIVNNGTVKYLKAYDIGEGRSPDPSGTYVFTAGVTATQSRAEYANGLASEFTGFTEDTAITLTKFDGAVVELTVDAEGKASSTAEGVVHIDGAATYADATFTNATSSLISGGWMGTLAYKALDNLGLQYDSTVTTNAAGTGAYLKHHPWIKNLPASFMQSEEMTIAVVGEMSPSNDTVFVHFGTTTGTNKGIFLASGSKTDEVVVKMNTGKVLSDITTMTVPHAATARHVYIITKKDVGDESTVSVYLDGTPWKTAKFSKISLTGGVQCGSDHGGELHRATPPVVNAVSDDDTALINVLRVYDRVISKAEINAYSSAYPYVSDSGTSSRTFTAAAENWVGAEDAKFWSFKQTATSEAVLTNAPVGTSAIKIDGTEDVTTTISVNLDADEHADSVAISSPGAFKFAKAEGKAGLIVSGQTTIGCPVEIEYQSLDISGAPLTLIDEGAIEFDLKTVDLSTYFEDATILLTGDVEQNDEKITCKGLTQVAGRMATFGYNGTQYVVTITVTPAPFIYTIAGWTWHDLPVSAEVVSNVTTMAITVQTDLEWPMDRATFTVEAGTLKATKAGTSAVEVKADATFDLNGISGSAYEITLAGGSLVNTGAALGDKNTFTTLTLTADSFVGGTSEITMQKAGYAATTLNLGGYTLTKNGANVFSLVGTTVNGAGTIYVTEGTLYSSESTTFTDATAAIKVGANGTLKQRGGRTLTVSNIIGEGGTFNNEGTVSDFTLTGTLAIANAGTWGTVTLDDGATINVGNKRNLKLAGAGTVDVVLTDAEIAARGADITVFTTTSEDVKVGAVVDKNGTNVKGLCKIEGGTIVVKKHPFMFIVK